MDIIATIIVHYNSTEETIRCLESVLAIKTKQFQHHVVLIDNGSKEALILPSIIAKKIVLLRSESNLGFAGGNNLAIRHALGDVNPDYLVLLNNDATVDPNAYETMLETMHARPELGLLNPKIYFSKGHEFHSKSYHGRNKGSVIWFAGGSIDWSDAVSFHRGVDEVDRGQFDLVSDTDFATGCCLMIRREVIESVGLLSENLFLYWEDVEYSLRVRQHGYQLGLEPKAKAWHDNAGSSDGAGSAVSVYYQTRNRIYLALRLGSWKAKRAALFLIHRYLQGNEHEQKAVWDALIGQMGKQPIA